MLPDCTSVLKDDHRSCVVVQDIDGFLQMQSIDSVM